MGQHRRPGRIILALWATLVVGHVSRAEPATTAPVDALADYQPPAGLTGTLVVRGSGTMGRFVGPLVEEFVRLNPGVTKDLRLNGSSHVPRQLGATGGVGVMSRPMSPQERQQYKTQFGHEPVEMVLAHDAILILVNAKNSVSGLTLAQLDALYGTERRQKLQGPAKTWGDLGTAGDFADRPVSVYGILEEGQGTVETLRSFALLGGPLNRDVHNIRLPENEWGQSVAGDENGVLYSIYHAPAAGARAVPVAKAAGDPFIAATPQTIADGTYPLGRELFVYTDTPEQPAVVAEFLRFCDSRQGQALVATHEAVPLSPAEVKDEAAKVKATPAP